MEADLWTEDLFLGWTGDVTAVQGPSTLNSLGTKILCERFPRIRVDGRGRLFYTILREDKDYI